MRGQSQSATLTVRIYTARVPFVGPPVAANFLEPNYAGYFPLPFPSASLAQFPNPNLGCMVFGTIGFRGPPAHSVPVTVQGVFAVATLTDGSEPVVQWQDFEEPQTLLPGVHSLIFQYTISSQEYTITG